MQLISFGSIGIFISLIYSFQDLLTEVIIIFFYIYIYLTLAKNLLAQKPQNNFWFDIQVNGPAS